MRCRVPRLPARFRTSDGHLIPAHLGVSMSGTAETVRSIPSNGRAGGRIAAAGREWNLQFHCCQRAFRFAGGERVGMPVSWVPPTHLKGPPNLRNSRRAVKHCSTHVTRWARMLYKRSTTEPLPSWRISPAHYLFIIIPYRHLIPTLYYHLPLTPPSNRTDTIYTSTAA